MEVTQEYTLDIDNAPIEKVLRYLEAQLETLNTFGVRSSLLVDADELETNIFI